MEPAYQDELATVYQGDTLSVMQKLAAWEDRKGTVHCCVTSPPYWGLRSYLADDHPDKWCEIGSERTPEEYVENLVKIFRLVRCLLRDDGTLWLNLGDSYARNGGTGGCGPNASVGNTKKLVQERNGRAPKGMKAKDLVGIPWMVALALRADGWYLRQDIIWHKPSCMPSSVTDRCTTAHEYLFLLTKSPRYFYDAEAIKEPSVTKDTRRPYTSQGAKALDGRDVWKSGQQRDNCDGEYRNRRSVWTIPTAPFKGAHFATFPPKLIEPCILAGTSAHGCCAECGKPWKRVTEKTRLKRERPNDQTGRHEQGGGVNSCGNTVAGVRVETLGWEAQCTCGAKGLRPDDLEIIETPTGSRVGEDPSLVTGRAGFNRPRGDAEGQRPITRYEQRQIAAQIKASPHRAEMESEAGSAFAHYVRTDRSGARPVPQALLDQWVERGWLNRVEVPEWHPPGVIPCTVLDPFLGSGTTAMVSKWHGRRSIGIELSEAYIKDHVIERINTPQKKPKVKRQPKSDTVAQTDKGAA